MNWKVRVKVAKCYGIVGFLVFYILESSSIFIQNFHNFVSK